jgi:hypothetical protein
MLGEDEDTVLPEQQQHDALGELANVICGNVVQALAGPQPVFRLDSPRIDPNPAPGSSPASGQSLTSTCISLESGWVELVLCVEDGPGAEVAPRACVPTTSAR